jgi:hypothetical protein
MVSGSWHTDSRLKCASDAAAPRVDAVGRAVRRFFPTNDDCTTSIPVKPTTTSHPATSCPINVPISFQTFACRSTPRRPWRRSSNDLDCS